MKSSRLVLSLLAAAILSGCAAVGPDYQRPAMSVPAHFKEAAPGWKVAAPADTVHKGEWWLVYGDQVLNDLVTQLNANNQNVQVSLANYRRARAAVEGARAGYYPTVSASGGATRSRTNQNSGVNNRQTLSLDASWEPDLWGRVSRSVEAGDASTQASVANLVNARLSAQAELVQNYTLLRVTDEQSRVTRSTIDAYQRTLRVTRNQYEAGLVTRVDVATAESQVRSAEANLLGYELTRRQYEHAIAILVGRAPAEFALVPNEVMPVLPTTPEALPSTLLERRPDVAAAERLAASANANIGVAQAAFYPSLTLSGAIGGSASTIGNLLSAPARTWSLGAALAASLFDGGLRQSQVDQAVASYDSAAAQYRQTVLQGFQEVEDNLSALDLLAQEAEKRQQALDAARDAERLALNQYQAGLVDFTTVANAQITRFQAEIATLQVVGRRYAASALLVKALGGGWDGALDATAVTAGS
ncbi:efflux transporter outer membrane subunit [Pigmentiphaga aceris]|uniref:Efflux transporter outer membrane subunit n=1 Tax=Pigmentiphaga aceris TaxID=1940612 RepID=A0A5C0AVU2_9BURK|nr:efflux transporter outer membrane subunit [Pigmentiphaga aceris]QEI05050.1 efflux transporter outer membrane subunit [Pigmentiphaga aceris]